MAAPTLYGLAGSPYVRAACVVLAEKGAPYEFVAIPMGAHKEPAHLARHPFGRVPAFEHDGFALYETQAILRYVDQVFPGVSLQPSEARAAARMNQIMGIVDWYVMPGMTTIAFQRLIVPRLGGKPDEAVIEKGQPLARTAMAELDRLSDGQPYLAGERLSLADLLMAPHYFYFRLTAEGKALGAEHPRLERWWDRMESRASMRNTVPQLG